MPRSAFRLAAAVALVWLAATAAAAPARSGAGARLLLAQTLRSRALRGPLRFAVSLPPGYASSRRRYPVVYFLHGLPAPSTAFRDAGYVARALASLRRRALLVAPQGARDGDSDPEYLDWGADRNWATALARELPEYVDSRYRTIPDRRGRAIVGVSAGGYGAMLIGLHNLDRFAVIESWSGYFHPTDPSGSRALDLGSPQRDASASAHSLVPALRTAFSGRPTFLAFYVGSRDLRFRAENERFHRELERADVAHRFRSYPGGHDAALWSRLARPWLALALAHLAG